MEKSELRNIVRQYKAKLCAERKRQAAQKLQQTLRAEATYHGAACIMLYASLPDEVPTLELLREEYGKHRIVLPKVIGADSMELRIYTGPDSLCEGAFHIPEPTGPLFTDYAAIQLMLIPGMAFDKSGNRLGRGKGYYDRFLQNPMFCDTPRWGICYDFQMMEAIPSEKHDVRMHRVLVY